LGRQRAAGDGGAVRWGIAVPDGARHNEGCLRGRRHGGAVACCVVRLVVNKEMKYTLVVSMFFYCYSFVTVCIPLRVSLRCPTSWRRSCPRLRRALCLSLALRTFGGGIRRRTARSEYRAEQHICTLYVCLCLRV
jgi:hypothetical protein